ncbi:MAG: hypothetical protein ACRC7N_11815 [Clostridium sp.]
MTDFMSMDYLAESMLIIILIVGLSIGYYIFYGITFSKIAKVEKQNNPWFAWIPGLNSYQLIKMTNSSMLLLIPIIAAFLSSRFLGFLGYFLMAIPNVYLYYKISDKYDVNPWWFILALFPPVIFLNIVGFWKLFKAAQKGPISNKIKTSAFVRKDEKKKNNKKKNKK